MDYNKLFKNWQQNYLVEARIDKIIAKYPDYENEIKQLSANDPSGNDKYLGWMVKQIPVGYGVESISKIVNDFHENRQRLDKKDIYQWKFEALRDKLDSLGKSKTQQKMDIKDATIKIYEDEDYLFIAPLNTGASCVYGAGTKWCISAKQGENYFNNYARANEINFIFLFNKKAEPLEPWSKIALCYYPMDKMSELANKIYETVSNKKQSFYDADNLWKSTPYDGLSRDEIYQKVISNPQEIYNAEDILSCKLTIPDSMTYADDIPDGLRRNSHLAACGEFLDELLEGQWTGKFQKMMLKSISKIRRGIESEVDEDKKKYMKVIKEIEKISQEKKCPFKFFKCQDIRDPVGVDSYDSEILRSLGYEEFAEVSKFSKFEAVLKVDYKKLGLKVPEFTLVEKVIISSRYLGGNNQGEYISHMLKHLQGDNEEIRNAMMDVLETNMEDKFYSRAGTRISYAIADVLKDLGLYEDVVYVNAGLLRDEAGKVDKSGFNVVVKFWPYEVDAYIKDYMVCKKIESDFGTFMASVKENLLETQRASRAINSRDLLPNREYLYWEPI